jgi:uncharacterized membrane protein YvbJ
MAFCSSCGNELREGAIYCDRCGAPTRSCSPVYSTSHRDREQTKKISSALIILGVLILIAGFIAYVTMVPHDINILLMAFISIPILVVALIMRLSVTTHS